jgi:hypothetical protein
MLVMHPARGTDLWYCFAGLALLASLAQRVEDSAPGYRQAFAATGFAGAVVLWFALSKPNAPGLLIIALTLAVVWGTTSRGRGVTHLPLLLMLCVVSLGVQAFYLRSQVVRSPQAALVSRPNSDLRDIATWARRSTAPEAVFAVPPTVAWSHFRSLAQRPIFVSWKDGSAILWDRPFVRAWWERLDALGMDLAEEMEPDSYANSLNRRYQRLTDQQLIGLRDRFSVRYWVVESGRQSRFRSVFQTRSYQVLEVGAPTSSSPGR